MKVGVALSLSGLIRWPKRYKKISRTGVELAIVVGGGNILRGAKLSNTGKSRVQADQIGMIATAINALFLQDTLEGLSVETRVVSALEIKNITEPFVLRNCLQYLKEKNVVILRGGREILILQLIQQLPFVQLKLRQISC